MAALGSFHAFLLAVVVAGVVQIALGVARAGFVAAFFPSSVIKGLLAAIGLLLILKQSTAPAWAGTPTRKGTWPSTSPTTKTRSPNSVKVAARIQPGAAVIGLVSLAILDRWEDWKRSRKVPVPAPLVVVLFGAGGQPALPAGRRTVGSSSKHLVQVPVARSLGEFFGFLESPDFSQWANPAVYTAGLTIAAVASLETLLNLEAVDKIDPHQRSSPPSRELWVQGIGNVTCGLVGGLPISSAIVRSSVNVNSGSKTKVSTIVHGVLLLGCVVLIPHLAQCDSPFVPGGHPADDRAPSWPGRRSSSKCGARGVTSSSLRPDGAWRSSSPICSSASSSVWPSSLTFILMSNLRQPIRRFEEKHLGGEVLHIALANQVSFFNRAALSKVFDEVPAGGHVLLDAVDTDYIDPDILDLIRDFREKTAPARGVEVSVLGFREQYQI